MLGAALHRVRPDQSDFGALSFAERKSLSARFRAETG
jgi:hypothetical protein